MIKKGVYAATLSVIDENGSLNIDETISHAENIIKEGLHGVFFFGSTGQSQLISMAEKKELVSKISLSKFKKNFHLGTGCNSLKETIVKGLSKHGYEEGKEYIVIKVPNIIDISYGRGVGYTFTEHNLGEEIHKISATKIRKEMRIKGELKEK